MNLGVPKEARPGEMRVAVSPETAKKFSAKNLNVVVESGAGAAAGFPDSEYEEAGARIAGREDALAADVVVKIAHPTAEERGMMKKGALLIAVMDVLGDGKDDLDALAEAGVTSVALELIPRITRAQAMDVLSSQANIAGYRAVVEAATSFGRLIPMMMTAAGSVPPARTIVLGVGVAGLQAIATAKRLGSQVEAFDVRPEVQEQVKSVGAKWLDLGLEESGAGEGGYAKELTEEGRKRQQEALTRALPKADIIITTAQIPGRRAPVLVTEEAVAAMRPGTVIVDMAAGSGGNCPLSRPDEIFQTENGVTLIGWTNLPSRVAAHSSRFFARNVASLLELLVHQDDAGAPVLKYDFDDEIVAKSVVTHGGDVRFQRT